MSFWKIAWRSIQERALASSLTGLSMALGIALMVLVLVIYEVISGQLSNDAQGYNFIISSGQGSPYDVVLTTVFHLGRPLNPFPYRYYKKFVDGEFAPYVDLAVPECLGDSYGVGDGERFRVVATTPDMFDKLAYGADSEGNELHYKFAGGRNFEHDHFFEAVVGSVAANTTGLVVGSRFRPTHGLASSGHQHDEFEVVGVMAPTGTANDRAIFINIEGFYLLEGHALSHKPGSVDSRASLASAGSAPVAPDADHDEEHDHDHDQEHNEHREPLPESQREVTSVLIRCKPFDDLVFDKAVNKADDRAVQAVAPISVVERLQSSFLAPLRTILLVLTVLIVIVAGVSILVSIYNSMSERSHDIAVMRALGASRRAVMSIILVESILLSLLGGLAGLALGHGVLAAASPVVEFYTGITVRAWNFSWQESLLVPALVAFATVVGFLPALTAYRTDVAKTLGGGR